jgi:hypothetical protein
MVPSNVGVFPHCGGRTVLWRFLPKTRPPAVATGTAAARVRLARPMGTEVGVSAFSSQSGFRFGIEEGGLGEGDLPNYSNYLACDVPALGTRPVFGAQQAEELADGMLPLSGMAHARLAIDAVAVAPAHSLAR